MFTADYKHEVDCMTRHGAECNCGVALTLLDECRGALNRLDEGRFKDFDKAILGCLSKMKLMYLVEERGKGWDAVYGEPNGESGIRFPTRELAEEFIGLWNNGGIIRTPIAYHPDECCGCTHFYFSRVMQEIIAICNECGMVRRFLTNCDAGDVIGGTELISRPIS